MALTCIQLCQRCTSLLRSRIVGIITLQYSTDAQHWPAALWNSFIVPVLPSVLQRSPNPSQTRQRWNLGVRSYCESHAKVQPSQTKHRNTDELPGTDMVSYQNPLSHQLIDGGMLLKEWQTALDLDDAPGHSALEEISHEEAVCMDIPAALPPVSISLKDYVNESETLGKLVQLGVQLWKLEQRPNVGSMLLRLDFQTDVTPRLVFLKQLGVEDSRLGYLISHNPFILTESLENLQARVAYLRSKKFSAESVASMVSRAPYLLNFSVKRMDNRLGFYQQQLGLSAQKTRDVVARHPRLLCGSLEPVKENLKICKLEMGFRENELQHIVTVIPKVLTANKRKLTQIFDYTHNTMNIPHDLIVKFPQVLNARYLRIKERHLFLQYLDKAQYDPAKPNYICLDKLVSLPDEAFCAEVASATLKDFELFQKTIFAQPRMTSFS
uniref:Transcription termination factor 3, mitochondrial n=1 Tax=Salmo trutta TaxID=8032 RepID=A0A674D9D3_SALTR